MPWLLRFWKRTLFRKSQTFAEVPAVGMDENPSRAQLQTLRVCLDKGQSQAFNVSRWILFDLDSHKGWYGTGAFPFHCLPIEAPRFSAGARSTDYPPESFGRRNGLPAARSRPNGRRHARCRISSRP